MTITKLKVILLIISILLSFQIYKNLTTPNTIGLINDSFKPLKNTPNGVSSQASTEDKKVKPFKMNTSISDAKQKIKKLILSYENTKLVNEETNYLHFVFTTNFFRFKDDVEFYFDSENNLIEFKSQSRIGYGDMGTNRERYDKIREDYITLK